MHCAPIALADIELQILLFKYATLVAHHFSDILALCTSSSVLVWLYLFKISDDIHIAWIVLQLLEYQWWQNFRVSSWITGFSALKEMDLNSSATHLIFKLSISYLVYNNRGFDDSDTQSGLPLYEVVPAHQASDTMFGWRRLSEFDKQGAKAGARSTTLRMTLGMMKVSTFEGAPIESLIPDGQ